VILRVILRELTAEACLKVSMVALRLPTTVIIYSSALCVPTGSRKPERKVNKEETKKLLTTINHSNINIHSQGMKLNTIFNKLF